MLADVLVRIDRRVQAIGLDRAKASRLAGLSADAIRNIERAVNDATRQGPTLHTITARAFGGARTPPSSSTSQAVAVFLPPPY